MSGKIVFTSGKEFYVFHDSFRGEALRVRMRKDKDSKEKAGERMNMNCLGRQILIFRSDTTAICLYRRIRGWEGCFR
jgi:hypothetical protein